MQAAQAAPLVKILFVALYPPGRPSIEIDGARVVGTRTEQGVTLVVARDDHNRLVHYVGIPFSMTIEESPTGLVVPQRTV